MNELVFLRVNFRLCMDQFVTMCYYGQLIYKLKYVYMIQVLK
jgi:hypothetical protein